jgi:predicted O-linked N-acetylglucosamine transferase (SPINDLY family)
MSNRNQRRAQQARGGSRNSPEPSPEEIALLVSLFNQGRLGEAEGVARTITELFPRFGFGWKVLGAVIKMSGRNEEAITAMRKAAELLPADPQAQTNLGVTLKECGRLEEAEACYRNALEIQPNSVEALCTLGNLYGERGMLENARDCYLRTVALSPDYPGVQYNLGNIYMKMGLLPKAEACFTAAIQADPGFPQSHYNLGNVLHEMERLDEAIESYHTALRIKPDFAEAYYNLGSIFRREGKLSEAIACFRQAISFKSGYIDAYSNLLACLNSVGNALPDDYLSLAADFGRVLTEKCTRRYTAWHCPATFERLKVGVVSGDLRTHPVGFFLESVLAKLDQTRLELIAYSTNVIEDTLTERIRPFYSEWKSLTGLSDEAAASLIHADGLHVLVDLSGHTERNRLPVFACKPAPIQVSWLGYFATTGVTEIDFVLADQITVPIEQQNQFTEKTWYLPDTRLCFTPPDQDPAINVAVAELPAKAAGSITYGCFQNLAKISDEVLKVWKLILDRVPESRVRFQCSQLDHPSTAQQFRMRIQQVGIETSRIEFHGAMSRAEYFAAHNSIDIILDTFPYSGGTTTCEALWMGVPTVTLAGNTMLARQGAGLLTAAGLAEWIADSEAEFISLATRKSQDIAGLALLRSSLRQQMLQSPLCNASLFADHFTEALWDMWKKKPVFYGDAA